MIVWRAPTLDEYEWVSPLAMIGDWYVPRSNDAMINRDGEATKTPTDPLPDRLRDLAEKAIAQGHTQRAIDAIDPIVHPPESDAQRGARNLGKF